MDGAGAGVHDDAGPALVLALGPDQDLEVMDALEIMDLCQDLAAKKEERGPDLHLDQDPDQGGEVLLEKNLNPEIHLQKDKGVVDVKSVDVKDC